MEKCPCKSQKEYLDCCAPFLDRQQNAPTAIALMRSRYTAHVKADIDYIIETVHPEHREASDRKAIESWAKNAVWKGLEIIKTKKGLEGDEIGWVVFSAHYTYNNSVKVHTENSLFKKKEGKWYFVEGRDAEIAVGKPAKIGRNDACYCGSGKKFKKCCAKK
ncbi:MAG: Unknown protein [uncultured Aureispira sp.]|uniref:YchJ-like middle NTF2-like domain-containing protein n=1 Tax=uncultured Aureispira sp. TaxID=1331704 RepID=A0A6S6S1N6_9BACT|nr:MAG: Unknown protein [uncultured Aureispira sp.]